MEKLFIEDLPLQGKKVLMRVDFNVPLDSEGHITDATRIEATLPSIHYVLDQGASLILMSHLGRPKNMYRKNLSLTPCAKTLSAILGKDVKMAPDCIGYATKQMVDALKPGEVILLENLRFHRAEEFPDEDPDFAKTLASYADFYVNEAFGAAHRKHSSTYTIAQYFPQKAACGFLMEKELKFLGKALKNPQRPFLAIVGGAKVASKIGVLKSLLEKVDTLLIGGGMSYTFLKAQNINIGNSLVDNDLIPLAHEIINLAKQKNVNLILPVDAVTATVCSNDAKTFIVDLKEGIPSGSQGFDIGPKTIDLFAEAIKKAKTILWNGPLGVYELDNFAKGSEKIASFIAGTNATTIVGGGDSIALINNLELADKFTHISTGGGATLEYIEFGTLPGIEVLSDKTIKSGI